MYHNHPVAQDGRRSERERFIASWERAMKDGAVS
jgi:hypothetical protein